ncbi:MAG: Transcription-repair-coupling factor [Legionellaceae bacterium]
MQNLNLFEPHIPQKERQCLYWKNLSGSAISLAISNLATKINHPCIIITPDMQSALQLETEIKFYNSNLPIFNFPDWETLPYDNFSPHQDIISQRIETLYHLPHLKQGVLIVPIKTLMQRLAPQYHVQTTTFHLKIGDSLHREQLRKNLEEAGYRCVTEVMEHGEFAIRGSLFDLFPMGSPVPYRIDLLDDEIDSIRTFEPETQRSLTKIEQIQALPAQEFPLTEESITSFRQKWRNRFSGNPTNCPIYQDISQGANAAGIEYYLPLFFEKTATLFDYCPTQSLFILLDNLMPTAQTFWAEINERYEQLKYDVTRPVLTPMEIFTPIDEIFQFINTFKQIRISSADNSTNAYQLINDAPTPNLTINNKQEEPLKLLEHFIAENPHRILFCAETAGRREALLTLFKKINLIPTPVNHWNDFLTNNISLGITIAPIERGLFLQEPPIMVVAENQLFGQQVLQRRRRRTQKQEADSIIKNLAELNIGDAVVHLDQGIGRYLGLETIKTGNFSAEYLTLEYAGGDKLYVPVSSLDLISRYSGVDPERAPLNKLGTEQWQKTKQKVAEQIRDTAAELLDIYSRRSIRKGYAFKLPEEYQAFAASFPFEETPDQQTAIENVIKDMTSTQPMDRLICGDVGFGKTEVAMRAAFIAAQNGKQVAILVPTTLLAQQHYQNFSDRFADCPIRIEVISRFRSAKGQQTIITQLHEGKVDVLIGTHKLLQENIQFANLGLVIIDEEHRFGVRQKERLKALRSEIDILTLTATPIPRTLNMSLSGLRELSIIATPPAKRLAVKTFVRERNKGLIREAIMRELLRGGQVFYLYNEVHSIEKITNELQESIPEARISIGHGQMRERELEQVMTDFYHHRSNILVCTTIIETGIDIPSANTIIIERADKFGLAQLHQLRGRVGRSHHQAYAYLLTPSQKSMTADAIKRLDAISSLGDLGAGFTLASEDLEIRGAGELLGEEQSGSMQAIGFSLYMELLERAIKALKSGKQPDTTLMIHANAEIDLQIPALIPEEYIPDAHNRLTLYKRIANAENSEALTELNIEMIDRFGLLPQSTKNLLEITLLKLKAKPLGIRKIEANIKGGRIDFEKNPTIDPLKLIQLLQQQPQLYKLENQEKLRFIWDNPNAEQKITHLHNLLDQLELKK